MPIVNCVICGKEFKKFPSQIKLTKENFCSRKCNGIRRSENLIKFSDNRKGKKIKKEHLKFGKDNPCWRGGKYIEPKKGYVMIRNANHPRARANGYVLEHILIAEKMIGRSLKPGEEVHHRNKNRSDNRPKNLKIYSNHLKHWLDHHLSDVKIAHKKYYKNLKNANNKS